MEKGEIINKRYIVNRQIVGTGEHSLNLKGFDLFKNDEIIIKRIENKAEWENWIKISKRLKESDSFHIFLNIYDCFESDCNYYVITEQLSQTLIELLEFNIEFVQHNICPLIHCLGQSLFYLEELHIIHNDIKPSNIMLSNDGFFKLIDFGNSFIDYNSSGEEYVQSRWYRAPEIILGCKWTNKIDIWSVGCVLFECIIGDVLFPADNDIDQLLMMRESLGTFPSRLVEESTKNTKRFKPNGQFIEEYENLIEENPIHKILGSCEYNELICSLLQLDPLERLTPFQLKNITISQN